MAVRKPKISTGNRGLQDAVMLRDRAIDSAAEGIILAELTKGSKYLIVYLNPAFERITGYSHDELIGKNCSFLQGSDKDQPGLDQIRQALKTHTSCRAVIRNYRKDGTMFWNELYLSPVRDESGKVAHYVGIAADITERVNAEQQ